MEVEATHLLLPRLGLTFCLAPLTHHVARGWVSIPVEMGLVLVVVVAAVAAAAVEATKARTVPVAGMDSGACALAPLQNTDMWVLGCWVCASCPPSQLTYCMPCAVDSRLLTSPPLWWILVESTTDRDVFFFLSPPAHLHLFLPRLTRSISFHAFIHVLERSYYYYYIRYNAPKLLLLVQVDPRLLKTSPQSRDYCSSSPLVKLAR